MQERVELMPHHDLWMRGARYGTLQRIYTNENGREIAIVQMDHPQVKRPIKVWADELKYL